MKEACDPDALLKAIGEIVASSHYGRLSSVSVNSADVAKLSQGGASKVTSQDAESDRQTIESLTAMMSAASARLTRPRLQKVIVGVRHNDIDIHGMLSVDEIRDSLLVFDDDGAEVRINVNSIWRIGDCWKLQSFGYDAKGGSQLPSSAERNVFRGGRSEFRRVTRKEFCNSLRIYQTDDPSQVIGTLIEGYRQYQDSRHTSPIYAVMVKTYVDDEVGARWMTPGQLSKTFFSSDDPALRQCNWNERTNPVQPLADEIPVDSNVGDR